MMVTNRIITRLSGFSFYSALIKIAWCFVFLLPIQTFAAVRSYDSMAIIANENVWGIALCMIGILHLASIFSLRLLARIIMQIVSIGVWLFMATMFGISNPVGTGLWTYAFAAMCDFIAIVYLLRFEKGVYRHG